MKIQNQTGRHWGTRFTLLALLVAAPLAFSLQSCTNLDEDTFGVVTPANFFSTEAEFVAALAPVYASMRDVQGGYWTSSEITTDEAIIPTRGTDWDDGGMWRQFHQHTWDATHPEFNGSWNAAFTGIARANTVLDNLASSTTDLPQKDAFEAELRTLRAFFYYQMMDLFGGVPIVTVPALDPDNLPGRNSRAEVFDFIVEELEASIPNLLTSARGEDYGRVTQGAARAILANMYLNAEIFTGTVTANGIDRGQPRWQDAVNMADAILNSGEYTLATNYFDNFSVANNASPENIFSATYKAKGGLGLTFSMRMLHYNQIPQSPWNGYSTLAEAWQSYSDEDVRKTMFLVGQQFEGPNAGCAGQECFATGEELEDRSGDPLVFTPEVPLVGAGEADGIRVLKFELDPAQIGGDSGNDYPIFRLAEIYLIKAEALNELGQTAEAVSVLNGGTSGFGLIDRAGLDDLNAADFTQESFREFILAERLREFMYEARRRQDLIRHGIFTSGTWAHKDASAPYRAVMPVPQPQIDSNPELVQNPGYAG